MSLWNGIILRLFAIRSIRIELIVGTFKLGRLSVISIAFYVIFDRMYTSWQLLNGKFAFGAIYTNIWLAILIRPADCDYFCWPLDTIKVHFQSIMIAICVRLQSSRLILANSSYAISWLNKQNILPDLFVTYNAIRVGKEIFNSWTINWRD